MRDRGLAAAWVAYHHELANIRVISKPAHRALAGQNRIRKAERQLRLDGGAQ
jgi:hypothetical protein